MDLGATVHRCAASSRRNAMTLRTTNMELTLLARSNEALATRNGWCYPIPFTRLAAPEWLAMTAIYRERYLRRAAAAKRSRVAQFSRAYTAKTKYEERENAPKPTYFRRASAEIRILKRSRARAR